MSDTIKAQAPHAAYLRMAELTVVATQRETLKKLVLSKPQDKTVRRAVITPRTVGRTLVLQCESFYTDNKAKHINFSTEDTCALAAHLCGFGQLNLITGAGECELRTSKNGKITLIGGEKLAAALFDGRGETVRIEGNNRAKSRILDGSEPFLRLLDVSDETGRVRDKKQSKFRQINRFLELIRDCEGHLPREGELRICDLCCGKSYLSFAAYHYFANVLGRKVKMTGVDLKPDVIDDCNDVAQKLHFDGLTFLCGDVNRYETDEHVHLVISLHACDVATDFVLGKALAWQADVILSTPCCHHEMNHTIQCEALSFITEHSMLRQKLCDAATDALRLSHLASEGYSVSALELIDPEETPKNIMLRAIRQSDFDRNSPKAEKLRARYEDAKRFLVGDATVAF